MALPLFGSSKKKMAMMNNPHAPVHNVSWDRAEEQATRSGGAKHNSKAFEQFGWPLPNHGQQTFYGVEPMAQAKSDSSNRSCTSSSRSTDSTSSSSFTASVGSSSSTGSTSNRRDPSKRMGGFIFYNASADQSDRI